MVILSDATYNEIVNFLSNYRGLSIECEEEIVKMYPSLPRFTIKSIISKCGQNAMKIFYYKFSSRGGVIVSEQVLMDDLPKKQN